MFLERCSETPLNKCTETEGVPYGSGATLQLITTYGEYADDARDTGIVGDVLAAHNRQPTTQTNHDEWMDITSGSTSR